MPQQPTDWNKYWEILQQRYAGMNGLSYNGFTQNPTQPHTTKPPQTQPQGFMPILPPQQKALTPQVSTLQGGSMSAPLVQPQPRTTKPPQTMPEGFRPLNAPALAEAQPKAGQPFTPNPNGTGGPMPPSPNTNPKPLPNPNPTPQDVTDADRWRRGTDFPNERNPFDLSPTAMGYADFQGQWDKLGDDVKAFLDYKTARDMWGTWTMPFIKAWFNAASRGKQVGYFQGDMISGFDAAKKIADMAKEEVSARRRAAAAEWEKQRQIQDYKDQQWNQQNMGYATSPRFTSAGFGKV